MREGAALERDCNFILFFLGGALGHGRLVVFASCSSSLYACLPVHYLLFLSGNHCSAS